MIEAALNANVTSWRSAPAATELEHVVIDWLKEMLGYPAEAGGPARQRRFHGELRRLGRRAQLQSARRVTRKACRPADRRMRFYVPRRRISRFRRPPPCSGLGEANVRAVPTDSRLRMDVSELDRA